MKIFFSISILFFSYSVWSFSKSSTSYLNFKSDLSALDAYSFDFEGDGVSEILVSFLNVKNRNEKVGVKIYSLSNGDWVDSTRRYFKIPPTFYHLRNVQFIKLNKSTQIIFSDHGPDVSPFVGGNTRMFESNRKNKFIDVTKTYLPDSRGMFTFSSSFSEKFFNNSPAYVLNNMKTKSSFLQIFGYDSNKKFINLAGPLSEKCFMSSIFWDFDKTGVDKLILGGCDVQNQHAHIFDPNDFIYTYKNGEISKTGTLDKRVEKEFFGVNFFKLYALNSKDILVRGSYNNSYTKSELDFYSYENNRIEKIFNFQSEKYLSQGFIPNIVSSDLNNDGISDLVGSIRPINGIFDGTSKNTFAIYLNSNIDKIKVELLHTIPTLMNWIEVKVLNERYLVAVLYDGKLDFYK